MLCRTLSCPADDFDKLHAFGDFAFWCVPGSVLVGAYPYMDHKQCTTYEQGEARLEKIIQDDITTFVSVQVRAALPLHTNSLGVLSGTQGILL